MCQPHHLRHPNRHLDCTPTLYFVVAKQAGSPSTPSPISTLHNIDYWAWPWPYSLVDTHNFIVMTSWHKCPWQISPLLPHRNFYQGTEVYWQPDPLMSLPRPLGNHEGITPFDLWINCGRITPTPDDVRSKQARCQLHIFFFSLGFPLE